MPHVDAAPETPSQRPAEASHASTPTRRIRLWVWWFGLVASSLVAGSLSILAYAEGLPDTLNGVPQVDKVLHFTIGALLAFFLDGVFRRRPLRVGARTVPLSAVAILVPAGIDELLQRFSPNRSSSFADFAADVAGVAFGVWLSRRADGGAP